MADQNDKGSCCTANNFLFLGKVNYLNLDGFSPNKNALITHTVVNKKNNSISICIIITK